MKIFRERSNARQWHAWKRKQSRNFSDIVGLFFLHLPNHQLCNNLTPSTRTHRRLYCRICHRICRLLIPSCFLFFIQKTWLRAAYLMRATTRRTVHAPMFYLFEASIHDGNVCRRRHEYMPTLYFSAQCQNPFFSLLFFSFLICLQPLYNYRLQLVHPTIDRVRSSDIAHFYSDYFIILTFGYISKRLMPL